MGTKGSVNILENKHMKLFRRKIKMFRREKAQGMTEYILIVALIALVAVASIQLFGEKIKARFDSLATTIAE